MIPCLKDLSVYTRSKKLSQHCYYLSKIYHKIFQLSQKFFLNRMKQIEIRQPCKIWLISTMSGQCQVFLFQMTIPLGVLSLKSQRQLLDCLISSGQILRSSWTMSSTTRKIKFNLIEKSPSPCLHRTEAFKTLTILTSPQVKNIQILWVLFRAEKYIIERGALT